MNKKLLGTLVLSFLMFGSVTKVTTNSTLEVKDVLSQNLTNFDARTVTPKRSTEVAKDVADEVKIQQKENENGTYTIRFVAGVSSVELEKITFNVTIKDGEKGGTKNYETNTVYTAIEVGSDVLTAENIFGEGYNYLAAYAISGIPASALEYTYTCSVDAYDAGDVVASSNEKRTTLKSIADLDNPVVLDGKMDDVLWTSTVKENKITATHPSNNTHYEFYTTRNSKGVYIYGKYSTSNPHDTTTGDQWWVTDNVEFRLTKPYATRPVDSEQFYVAALNGGTYDATDGYVSPIALNPETNKYEMVYEIFIDYTNPKLNVTPLTPLGFHWASAPKDGWFTCSYWYNDPAFNLSHKVSYYDEAVCSEHQYSEYTIIKNPSIEEEGLQTRICYVCNHVDTKTIANVANLVTEPKTEAMLGWAMFNRFTVDGTKAWTMQVSLNSTRFEGATGWGDQFVAGIFKEGTTEGWDFRSDWCGGNAWNGTASYTDVNGLGKWPDYFSASNNMNVKMLITFNPDTNTITYTMSYESLSNPSLPVINNIVYRNTGITYRGNIDVAFGVQNGTVTVTEAYLLEGSLA